MVIVIIITKIKLTITIIIIIWGSSMRTENAYILFTAEYSVLAQSWSRNNLKVHQ